MPDSLKLVLDHLGHSEREPQRRLYEHLLEADRRGVIAQAGTGVGKSLAVLSAAADSGGTSLVVVPTNILMNQYAEKDAPAFEAATGAVVRTLKGRAHYLCSSAPGWVTEDEVKSTLLATSLDSPDIVEVSAANYAFGCPGGDDCDPGGICHYRMAKERLDGADIIVTNAHLAVIDAGLKQYMQGDLEDTPHIFPSLDQQFVDEAHTFEEVVRSFTSLTISDRTIRRMGEAAEPLMDILARYHRQKDATAIERSFDLGVALQQLAAWEPTPGEKKSQRFKDAAKAAKRMLASAAHIDTGQVVLWVEPRWDSAKLIMTRVSIASLAGQMLSHIPFGLVSATVPVSMAASLGVPGARFIDVGHPFDYSAQAKIGFSSYAGDYKSSQSSVNFSARAHELRDRILAAKGGALLLFSAFRDLEAVHEEIGADLRRAGLTVLLQDREADKGDLGRRFKESGNAVLFASKSFATGFDAPGDALRLVGIWKLPYPGNSPVMDRIRQTNWQRYEDAMLVDVTQAIGRLIRTADDRGEVWVCDSRGRAKLLGRPDPLLRHLSEFAQS